MGHKYMYFASGWMSGPLKSYKIRTLYKSEINFNIHFEAE